MHLQFSALTVPYICLHTAHLKLILNNTILIITKTVINIV